MRLAPRFAYAGREHGLEELPAGWRLDDLVPGEGPWEVEIGFGKGRYLLAQAGARPERRFLGIEVAAKYFRLTSRRAARRGLRNLLLVHGEALYLLAAVLPAGFADLLHVYFPDPWPKSRHHKRRLFDPESLDLVLGPLVGGGKLCFATDFLDYGAEVEGLLASDPGLRVETRGEPWPDGARTNYEGKYLAEGRPILRLEAWLETAPAALYPGGRDGVAVGPRTAPEAPCAS